MNMDNNVFFNIIRHADNDTSVNIIKAKGGDMFQIVRDMDYCRKIHFDHTKNCNFDIFFSILDDANSFNIIQRIKLAFNNQARIIRLQKSYLMAAQGIKDQYQLTCPHVPVFLEGLIYINTLLSYGEIQLLDDVRLTLPSNYIKKEGITILNIANIFDMYTKKIEYNMFYLDINSLVNKFRKIYE